MSKLAHSNQETMDQIERDARERDERGDPADENSLRSCATCGAILAPGPQPAATYEPQRITPDPENPTQAQIDAISAAINDADATAAASGFIMTKRILRALRDAGRT